MSIVPWRQRTSHGGAISPFDSMTRFRDEVDDIFSRFFGPLDLGRSMTSGLNFGPRMDVAENEKSLTVSVELPGVSPEDIDLNVTGNTLSIKGEKKSDRQENEGEVQYVERQFGAFGRTIQLPATVDAGSVDARFKNGILTIELQKKPEAVAKRIPVKAG